MQNLTPVGQNIVNDIASRYQLSQDAVIHMLVAVNNGGGSMAQFSCPELGGSGQWMQGGMTMVGDMFNNGLKATVENLCSELSGVLANNQMFPVIPAGTPGSSQWWPAELGAPFSSGAQNNTRYAVFPQRLAVEIQGDVVVYDTLDHQISGVSQQQGGDTSLQFSSQYGTISVASLPVVSGQQPQSAPSNFASPPPPQQILQEVPQEPAYKPEPQSTQPEPQVTQPQLQPQQENASGAANEIIQLLEQLGRLRDADILTSDEFDEKKRELMARI